MRFQSLDHERHGPVLLLRLRRPDSLNALNAALLDELEAALDEAEADPGVRAIVLAGAGRAFSAGFDLKESAQRPKQGVADWRPLLERDLDLIMRFWRSPRPTVAAVHGFAIAGGMELALACDITIAAEGTRLGEPELRFGSGIVALLLPWMTGPKQAKELLLTGNDRLDARDALALGLVNRVVPAGEHERVALAVAHGIAVMDPDAVRLTKQAINRTVDIMGMREALAMALDIDVQIESMETPERRTFNEINRRQGLKAAIAWRESRFDPDAS